jgi:hypothetical protein
VGGYFRQPHAEARLVEVGFDERAGGVEQGFEFRDGLAQAGAVLGGDEDGNLEGRCGAEEFLRCEDPV